MDLMLVGKTEILKDFCGVRMDAALALKKHVNAVAKNTFCNLRLAWKMATYPDGVELATKSYSKLALRLDDQDSFAHLNQTCSK